LSLGGETVEIAAMQLRRLLCMLLLAPGRPVQASTAIDCLWPGDDPSAPRAKDPSKSLRIYISRLRGVLPEPIGPRFDVRGYWLDIAEDQVDVARFEGLLHTAARCTEDDPATAADLIRTALAMWRGPALADCRDEAWAIGSASRLDELRLSSIERLADARLRMGDHSSLCGELEQFVGENPFRERSWAQLMLSLYRSGRQADALRTFQRLRAILRDELGIEPSRDLVELDSAIVCQDPQLDLPAEDSRDRVEKLAVRGRRSDRDEEVSGSRRYGLADRLRPANRLPEQLTGFVGRRHEIGELRSLVDKHRLVTLTGPGGVGKTRLALEVARELLLQWPPDSIAFVDLSSISSAEDVAPEVASALGVGLSQGAPATQTVADAIGDEGLLVLLDNCEQVAECCAAFCAAVLRSCSGLSIVATSRQALGVEGERLYSVPPLSLPVLTDDVAGTEDSDCVALFVERARALLPTFSLDESNAGAVVSICHRVDGIPLAVELAAARVNVLAPAQISDALEEQFRLLGRTGEAGVARHRTLDALIGWSYELLDKAERSLLRRLTVFVGGFDLEAVLAVSDQTGQDEVTEVNLLASLVGKSLVNADTSGDTARYGILETIRHYATARLLEEDGEVARDRLRDAHATFFTDFAIRAGEGIWSPDQFAWIARLDLDFLNIRAAFDHLLTRGSTREAMRLIADLGRFCSWTDRQREWEIFTAALEGRPELGTLDQLAIGMSIVCAQVVGLRDPASAVRRLEAAFARARELGDDSLAARALDKLSWLKRHTGDEDDLPRLHREALELARKGSDKRTLINVLTGPGSAEELTSVLALTEEARDFIASCATLGNLADRALVNGDFVEARTYSERALAIAEAGRGSQAIAEVLVNLGLALVLTGEIDDARDAYRAVIPLARRQLDPWDLSYALLGLGLCASRDGDLALAATLFGAARESLERDGFAVSGREAEALASDEARIATFIGPAKFEAAVGRGRSLSKDDMASLALGRLGPVLPARSGAAV
jgi:predicted ATPase/DNA-binding SARP family transcriptional activator